MTEELHLITFETEVYHQGLKIDLEVSSAQNLGRTACRVIQDEASSSWGFHSRRYNDDSLLSTVFTFASFSVKICSYLA